MNSESFLRFSQSVCLQLGQAFDTAFKLWLPIEGKWFPTDNDDNETDATLVADVSTSLLENVVGPQPVMSSLRDCGQLLVVPICNNVHVRAAAVGVLKQQDPQLALRLADSVRLNVIQQRDLESSNSRVNEYALQVTSDFEELVWLRDLAEMIEICDLRNDIANVAEAALPTLRLLIQAEAIFLFGVPSPEDIQNKRVVGPLRFHVGEGTIQENRARQIVEHLHSAAALQPVVRNSPDGVANVEDVRNCILIRLSRGGFQSGWLLAINKLSGDKSCNCLSASALSHWEFGTFEAGLVNAAGIMLATHSRNIELFREKETLLVGVIRALINAIDAKDAYTLGHSDRVALMSKQMALNLGLSDAECERIYMAGMLHDIGKIGVPDRVLGKPDKLTDEEFSIIKTHPEIGVEILKHLEPLSYVLPGVLHHHEMVNGRGYPHGLIGEAIPLVGRILAVADAYDAMTSDRPYRKGMSTEKAEGILRKGAGTQWDSRVIDAFFSVLPDIYSICGTGGADTVRRPTFGISSNWSHSTARIQAVDAAVKA